MDQGGAAAAGDEVAAAWREGTGGDAAEDVAFVGVAGEDDSLGAYFLDAGEEGFEHRAGGAGGVAGDDELDADVAYVR